MRPRGSSAVLSTILIGSALFACRGEGGDLPSEPGKAPAACDHSRCTAPDACGLDGVCARRPCLADLQCGSGRVCSAGMCVEPALRADVVRCEVIPRPVTVRVDDLDGARLSAIAYDEAGRVVPRAELEWTLAYGSFFARWSDGAAAVECSGAVPATVLPRLAEHRARVVAVEEDGFPVTDAVVVMLAGEQSWFARTSSLGVALFTGVAVPSRIDSITVIDAERTIVSVLQPQTNDLVLSLPRRDENQLSGFTGDVAFDPAEPRRDAQFALSGLSLAENLLDYDPGTLFGDPTTVTIHAPEILGDDLFAELPGGAMMALASGSWTRIRSVDVAPARTSAFTCVDHGLGSIGCYFLRTRPSFRAVWTLSAQLELSRFATLAQELSGTELHNHSVAHLGVGRWLHGSVSARQIGEGTTIEQQLDARRPASIQHLAAFPRLHRRGARTMLVAAARSPGTGLVPLGFGGGEDEDLDATVDAIEQPFGELSSPSLAGTLPIELAPPHDELDGSPIALIATSISELGLTTRVVPFDTTSALTVLEDFLPLAGATLDRATNTVAVHGLDSAGARTDLFRADLLRVELVGPRRTWRIYTPSTASFTLPALEEARAVLAAGPAPPPRVSITAAELADDYASLWDLRGQRIGRPDTVRAFSTHFADETR